MAFEYDWIVRGLAQGTFPGSPEVGFREFDVIVLCAEEHQPRWSVPHGKHVFKLPLDDDDYHQVPTDVGRIILGTAHAAGTYHLAGRKVVTTCHQGRNRSGLVSAAILILHYRMPPAEAIRLVQQRRRHPHGALANPMFVQFLHNYRAYL